MILPRILDTVADLLHAAGDTVRWLAVLARVTP